MIELSRRLARQFHTVLRRVLPRAATRGPWPLLCRTGQDGLTLEAQDGDVAVRYQAGQPCPPEALAFRCSVLAELQGGTDAAVTLEQTDAGKGLARWSDRDVPRLLEFETVPPDSVPALPGLPATLTTMPDDFLVALDAAVRTTAAEGHRTALTRLLLRGKPGEIVATDGRQLLIQGGFRFGWPEDVLVPRLPVFGHRDLTFSGPALLGRTASHVGLSLGPWTFLLAIDASSRFPDYKAVLPQEKAFTCRLQLHPEDAAFLVTALPKLAGRNDDHTPVTLDLGTPVSVRARDGSAGAVTETVLCRSRACGTPTQLVLNRQLLQRVAQMGFSEVQVVGPAKPLQCRDGRRVYALMPLDKQAALPAGVPALRIASADGPAPDPTETPGQPDPGPEPERRSDPMPEPSTNGRPPERGGINELIAEAEQLRMLLADATTRLGRLLSSLKEHRRQARALQAAVSSLRRMKLDG